MPVELCSIGQTGLMVPPLGFGAFKIGRNQGIKYPQPYDLPDDAAVAQLLDSVIDLGCTLIDTAPAYGLSEERIGRAIGARRSEIVLSTKVGESFADGQSTFDFSRAGVEASLQRSLKRLRTDVLDIVFIHSNGDDDHILTQTDTVAVLQEWKARGAIRAIGLSGKTLQGARQAMSWADALMVEYHLDDTSHAEVMAEAARRNIAVFVKKGLASGRLPADEAIRFVLSNPAVTTLILGGLNFVHFQHNWQTAVAARSLP